MGKRNLALTILMWAALCGCRSVSGDTSPPMDEIPKFYHLDPDLKPIRFKPGHPTPGEHLKRSLLEPENVQMDILSDNLALFQSVQNIRTYKLEVLGFASSSECVGEDCIALSKRRAGLTATWLLEQGLKADRITRIEGMGTCLPIGDESTDIGRSGNRRVEVNLVQ